MPGLHVPLSTLRGRARMTRGRFGPLTLHRTTLALAAPRRFNPVNGGAAAHSTCRDDTGMVRGDDRLRWSCVRLAPPPLRVEPCREGGRVDRGLPARSMSPDGPGIGSYS